jgi:hypothetical protein
MRGKRIRMSGFLLLGCLFLTPAASAGDLMGLEESDLHRFGEGGFGDSANSYAWSIAWHNHRLYVGTVRHHLWSLLQQLGPMLGDLGDFLPDDLLPDPPQNDLATQAWADEMAGRIYRFTGRWREVYRAETYQHPGYKFGDQWLVPPGYYPKAYGYRALGEYEGFLYALGVGTWVPPWPYSTVIRSADGNDWEDVTGELADTTNVRGLVEWQGKLYVAASIPWVIPALGAGSLVYSSSDPKSEGWTQVSEIGFGNDQNAEIYYLAVFEGCLYASTVNFNTGFEVWKTCGDRVDPDDPENQKLIWHPVIVNGFGDTWNQYGMHLEPFGDHLYVGTAVGAGMVRKGLDVVGSRPTEIIRVDASGKAELVVGGPEAHDPISGGPIPRTPLSGLSGGFGNPFNVYTWHMGVYRGWLYAGTFDIGGFFYKGLAENPDARSWLASSLNIPLLDRLMEGRFGEEVMNWAYDTLGGGDIWKTRDGVRWLPVTLNGLNNPKNYGIRRVVPIKDHWGRDVVLTIGTANPFTGKPDGGCEVHWLP